MSDPITKHLESPLPANVLEQRMRAHSDRAAGDPVFEARIAVELIAYVEAELADPRWVESHAVLRKHLDVYRSWLSKHLDVYRSWLP